MHDAVAREGLSQKRGYYHAIQHSDTVICWFMAVRRSLNKSLMSNSEIAKILDVSQVTISRTLTAAYITLAEHLYPELPSGYHQRIAHSPYFEEILLDYFYKLGLMK